jgi:hypothetical protein
MIDMFGLSRYVREQFNATILMMLDQNLGDSEVIGVKGFFVSTKMGEEQDRIYLDKELKRGKAFYIYHKF